MLDEFIRSNREAIIQRAQARVASRKCPVPRDEELTDGIPAFLDELGEALRVAKASTVIDHEQIGRSARRHAQELLRRGFTVAQVVHGYGDVCQTVTALAVEKQVPISGDEFRTFNLCLDDAIAEAVTEYSRQREQAFAEEGMERLGVLAHELRNLLNLAMLSFESIKSGRVAVNGSTGTLCSNSLMGLRDLIHRSLADVRLDAGLQRVERIGVSELIEEIEIGAVLQAQTRGLRFAVSSVARAVSIDADRQIVAAALVNLLQNAFKFTREDGTVSLSARATADRVLFDIADECGGLPPGKADELFRPFEQRGSDLSGVGLGLSICARAAKASGGAMRVIDVPGKGCVFTLDLPRSRAPLAASV